MVKKFIRQSVNWLTKVGFMLLLINLSVTAVKSEPSQYLNGNWSNQFFVSGLANADEGYSLAVFEDNLIVSGSFEFADGIAAQNIARWDGAGWANLGNGLDTCAYALIVFNGELMAGLKGHGHNLVKWNGSDWQALSFDFDGDINAFAIYDNYLVIGGDFTEVDGSIVNCIVWYDGLTLYTLGLGFNNAVNALAIYNGDLIAGGRFDSSGTTSANRIARWDGINWYPIDEGLGVFDPGSYDWSNVEALIDYNGALIAGGNFETAGGVYAENIAAWDGLYWSPLGSGINGRIKALHVYDNKLIAAGRFDTAGDIGANNIAAWDGSSWDSLGAGTNSRVGALTLYNGFLIVEGEFALAGGQVVNGIAGWDGAEWSRLSARQGQGFSVSGTSNHDISCLQVYDGSLVAGGRFIGAGNCVVNNLASWDGIAWTAIPFDAGDTVWVHALAEYNGELIVGGEIKNIEDLTVNNIARWNGVDWQALGSGLTSNPPEPWEYSETRVNAITTIYDGKLVVGGIFDYAGNVPASNIALWDGSIWLPLGSGMVGDYFACIYALTVYDGKLIAGGEFTTAGGVAANYIASWDGSGWSPLGSGMDDRVYALTVYDGKLVAGGSFTTAGGVTANYIASWDGNDWSPLGSGIDTVIAFNALMVYEEMLVVAGYFSSVDGITSENIAIWDGEWRGLNLGLQGEEACALAIYNGSLFIGGDFLKAGGYSSTLIAQWTEGIYNCCEAWGVPGDANADGVVNLLDILFVISFIYEDGPQNSISCDALLDAKGDGNVNLLDILRLISYLYQSGPAPVCPEG